VRGVAGLFVGCLSAWGAWSGLLVRCGGIIRCECAYWARVLRSDVDSVACSVGRSSSGSGIRPRRWYRQRYTRTGTFPVVRNRLTPNLTFNLSQFQPSNLSLASSPRLARSVRSYQGTPITGHGYIGLITGLDIAAYGLFSVLGRTTAVPVGMRMGVWYGGFWVSLSG
jgi:hypothetical protein